MTYGLYWADTHEDVGILENFRFREIKIPKHAEPYVDHSDALSYGLNDCDSDSWFVDGYPGQFTRSGRMPSRFIVRNFETGDTKEFEVETEFTPSFSIYEKE